MVLPIAHEEESVGFNGEGKNGSEDKLSSIGEVVTTELVAQKVEGTTRLDKIWKGMLDVESRSIQPLDEDERTDAKPRDNFTLWLSMNGTIACFALGTLAPLLYGLSLRDASLVIIFCNVFSCGIPSYLATFGPILGIRTMVFARYSFGLYFASWPALLNLITFIIFCVLNSIVAGQTLAQVNRENLSVTVGIVIVAVISLVISFGGYRTLHFVERYTYIPVTFAFIVLCAYSGTSLKSALNFVSTPATAGTVLSFAAIVIGFTLSWSAACLDFNTYFSAKTNSMKIFWYTMTGLWLPCVFMQIAGAAFACAALSMEVDGWADAFANDSVGGLFGVALLPMGGFGKFLLVILSIGIISNNAPTLYAFSLSIYVVFPFLNRFPKSRPIFPIIASIIYVPLSIVGNNQFAIILGNLLGILGYWSAIFSTVVLIEHFIFRRASFAAYKIAAWDTFSLLPMGIAALASFVAGIAGVVIGMDQTLYRGVVAIAIAGSDNTYGGDVAIWLGITFSGVVYLGARWAEIKYTGR